MNRNYNILSGALLLLVSGTCFQSCQQDDFGDLQPDMETLVAEGRYLTARSVDASELASDTEEPRLFAVGTPYRLLAFTKKYDEKTSSDKTLAEKPRFNKVAWEGETDSGMRFINIDSEPDKWFGFSALDGEDNTGTDHLVSLDFYGFTYGKKVDNPGDYIPVDGWKDDGSTNLSDLTRTEEIPKDGELNDLMRGVLLNQNIQTAGKSDDGNTDNAYTQSIMPFRHCFSKLRFQISQQGDEEKKDADGNPTPYFENLYVGKIEVTGTYGKGKVYLYNGKVELSGEPCDRNLPFKSGFSGQITTKNTDVGDMIVFPSDGSALTGTTMGDGYNVGLSITVKSTVKKDIENMLVNTGSVGKDGKPVIKEIIVTNDDGTTTTWYQGTIHKDNIVDYYNTTPEKEAYLHFKQNTSYMLIITFQKDAVRIITVIPQVEEWLPGEINEGTKEPWQEQALGQPQMFDNIVWSDRNLGADHYDPKGDDGVNFEKTIGYFYQAGRNIPYYPLKFKDYTNNNKQPTIEEIKQMHYFANNDTKWKNENYRFFPVVDPSILLIGNPDWWVITYKKEAVENGTAKKPQMYIPETKPTDRYFDFMVDETLGDNDMNWNEGPANQPVSGSWVIPSSKDFLSVFPSTPHAGNITFNKVGDKTGLQDWGLRNDVIVNDDSYKITDTDVLRVTVPYYTNDSNKPTGRSAAYQAAWQMLKDHDVYEEGENIGKNIGTTHLDAYAGTSDTSGHKNGEPGKNIGNEPDGDPEDGYASVYIISFKDKDKVSLSENLKSYFQVKEWGTIYAIKRVFTDKAYRMRWRALIAQEGTRNPSIYIEVCRYRCNAQTNLTEENFQTFDWDHPAATIYFPVCGLGDHPGQYINYGTECQYATSDKISGGKVSALQIKITGDNAANAYISVIKNGSKRHFGMQIRPVGGVNISK